MYVNQDTAALRALNGLSTNLFQSMTNLAPKWLVTLASDPTPQGRLMLANAVTELLDNGSATEQELVADILLEIVKRAELDLRHTLAEKLAGNKNAPRELMVWLANDEIHVARPVIILSKVLEDTDLINIIHQRESAHRVAVAQRGSLDHSVVKALVMSHDTSAMQTLLRNDKVALEESAVRMLVQAAKKSELLKQPLVARPELRSDMALEIFWWVSQELRQSIQQRFTLNRALIDEALEGTLQEILSARTSGLENITPEIRHVAQQLHSAQRITSGLLITVLRRGHTNLFVALFAQVLALPIDKVSAMLSHASGQFLAVCCRAQNILKPDFASIFLLGRAGRTNERVVDPQELSRTLRFYDQLSHAHALLLLQRWQRDNASLNLTHEDVSVALQMLAK